MNWRTHAVIGANAVWITPLYGDVGAHSLVLFATGMFTSLLPDIDAASAKIQYVGKGIFGMFRGALQHRGFLHSILAVLILFVLCIIFLTKYNPLIPYAAAFGYLSHLLIDGFNYKGVRYFFPLKRMFHLVPKLLASPVKGLTDNILFVLGIVGILVFFFSHFQSFMIPYGSSF